MNLAIVQPQRGSAFIGELLEVVADEMTQVGASVSMHVGQYPPDDGECIYLVVPHEYFVLTASTDWPTEPQMARTIAFCVEHPGNATFEVTAEWAGRLGAAVDINRDSTAELRRRGIATQRFELGYSRRWDAWGGEDGAERQIDITYLGTTDIRRDRLLGRQAAVLAQWRGSLLIPPHEQMTRPRPDFLLGADKYRHLAGSRILVNLHRGGSRALEWVRVLESMCNGCAVVSETSVDFEPLVAGRHIAWAHARGAADEASALLRQPRLLTAMRDEAYALCQQELSMRPSAIRLLELAEAVSLHRLPAQVFSSMERAQPETVSTVAEPQQPEPMMPAASAMTAQLPLPTRAALAALIERRSTEYRVAVTEEARAPGALELDVVIAATGDDRALAATLLSLHGQDVPHRVLVARTGPVSAVLGVPRGQLRNAALAQAETRILLFIDPGQQLFAGALRKLLNALDEEASLAATYSMAADPASGALWNALPPEAARLQERVYLAAPLMIRAEAVRQLGGYSEAPALVGFEDHDLWVRLLKQGFSGRLVPQILVSGVAVAPPPLGVSSLTPEIALASLRAALPRPPMDVARHPGGSAPSPRSQDQVTGFAIYLAARLGAQQLVRLTGGIEVASDALVSTMPIVGWNCHADAAGPPDADLSRSIVVCRQLSDEDGAARTWASLKRSVALAPAAIITCDPGQAPAGARPVDWFRERLASHGLAPAFAGWSNDPVHGRDLVALVENEATPGLRPAPGDLRVTAIVTVFNERDVIASTVDRLLEGQVDVIVIDNWSNDGTYELLASRYQGSPHLRLERFPFQGPSRTFDLRALLDRADDLAADCGADWVIRNDADEVRESPWPGLTLRDALFNVQLRGFDCVDHTVLEFRPTSPLSPEEADPLGQLRHFEFGQEVGHFTQVNTWLNRARPVGLAGAAGHAVSLEDRRVFPYKFLLRHYPLRSQPQAEQKVFVDRQGRWNPEERAIGWHTQYDDYRPGHTFVWDARTLVDFNDNFAADHMIERLSGVGLSPRVR